MAAIITANINNNSTSSTSIGLKISGKGFFNSSNSSNNYDFNGIGFQLLSNANNYKELAIIDTSNHFINSNYSSLRVAIVEQVLAIKAQTSNNNYRSLLINSNLIITSNAVGIGIGTAMPVSALQIQGDLTLSGVIKKTDGSLLSSSQWSNATNNQSASSNIYYNQGFVGIGTTSPQSALHVQGNVIINGFFKKTNGTIFTESQWSNSFINNQNSIYYNQGFIGIGTTAPQSLLHLHTTSDVINLGIKMTNSNNLSGLTFGLQSNQDGLLWNNSNSSFIIGSSNQERLRITSNAKIGIGTTNPRGLLDIRGDLIISGLIKRPNGTIINQQWSNSTAVNSTTNIYYNQGFVGIGTTSPQSAFHIQGNVTVNGFLRKTNGTIFAESQWSNSIVNNQTFINYNQGFIGIGTTVPQSLLHLHTASDVINLGIKMTNSNNLNGLTFGIQSNQDGLLWNNSNSSVMIANANQERMKITNNGRIGIGTTNPQGLLDIRGNLVFSGRLLQTNNILYTNSNSQWSNTTTTSSNIYYNQGFVGIGTTAPQSSLHLHSIRNNSFISINDSKLLLGINSNQDGLIITNQSSSLLFGTTNQERLRISSNGLIGIGTTNPNSQLTINGNVNITSNLIINNSLITSNQTINANYLFYSNQELNISNYNYSNTLIPISTVSQTAINSTSAYYQFTAVPPAINTITFTNPTFTDLLIVGAGGNGGGCTSIVYSTSGSGTVSAITTISSTNDAYLSFTAGSTILTLNSPAICDILIIGGGGAGANAMGGGGGAGGVVYQQNVSLSSGSYTITVGIGGTANTTNANWTDTNTAPSGTSSKIEKDGTIFIYDGISFEGKGGGGGGGGDDVVANTGRQGAGAGADGGSGGGAGGGFSGTGGVNAGSSTQGNTYYNGTANVVGGYAGNAKASRGTAIGGGGGGAGSVGGTKNGGTGVQLNITGTNTWYAGGGGGGVLGPGSFQTANSETSGGAGGSGIGGDGAFIKDNQVVYTYPAKRHGTDGTGSGGGGGAYDYTWRGSGYGSNPYGGNGGSGIVIIRFKNYTTVGNGGGGAGEVIYYPNYLFSSGIYNFIIGKSSFISSERISRITNNTNNELIRANGGGNGGNHNSYYKLLTENTTLTVPYLSTLSFNYNTNIPISLGTYTITWDTGVVKSLISSPSSSYPILIDANNNTLNPVLWFKFDGSSSFLNDSIGTNNLWNSNATYDTTNKIKGDGSIKFASSSGQFCTLPTTLDLNAINTANGISFSLWFRGTSSTAEWANLFIFGTVVPSTTRESRCVFMGRVASGGTLQFYIFNATTDGTAADSTSLVYSEGGTYYNGNWNHIVWTIDKTGNWCVYENGKITTNNVNKSIIPPFTVQRKYVFGNGIFPSGTNYSLDGNMDDFRIYPFVLNQAQVSQLCDYYYDYSYPSIKDNSFNKNLFLQYSFDSSTTFLNDSFNNNDLTNSSSPATSFDSSTYIRGSGSLYIPANAYVSVKNEIKFYNMQTTTGISFSVWFKLSASGTYGRIFEFRGSNSSTDGLYVDFPPTDNGASNFGNIRLIVIVNSGDYLTYVDTTKTYLDNKWYHLVWSISTTGVWAYYINGVNMNISKTKGLGSTTDYKTAKNIGIGLTGNLDDFRIYNKVLLQSEISDLYNDKTTIINPIAWYKFDDTTNLGLDSSENAYNLTNNGTTTTSTDRTRGFYSVLFDATDKKLTTPSGSSYTHNSTLNNGNFSISFWVKKTRNTTQEGFMQFGNVGNYGQRLILLFMSDNKINFGLYGKENPCSIAYTNNTWHHIVFSYNNTTRTVSTYGNGELDLNQATTDNAVNLNSTIYFGMDDYNESFQGLLDDVRIYNQQLSLTQVKELYKGRIEFRDTPALSTSGGSGGGGSFNQSGATAGILNNENFSLMTSGQSGAGTIGGNGGSATASGGYTTTITGSSLTVGTGGTGVSGTATPVVKTNYGDGGDGNGGLGYQGVIIVRVPLEQKKHLQITADCLETTNLFLEPNCSIYKSPNFDIIDKYWFRSSLNQNNVYYLQGNVGIGTNRPFYKLDVTGDINLSSSGKYKVNGANLTIASTTFSDARIKTNITDINDDASLNQIIEVKPKTFHYIDTIENTSNLTYGFIAQQVKPIISHAITVTNEFIPNIYKTFSCINNQITTTEDLTSFLTAGSIIKIREQENELSYISATVLFISPSLIIIDKYLEKTSCFIYGSKVNDFHLIDKTYLYTISVCATQDLYKKIMDLNKKLDEQQVSIRKIRDLINSSLTTINQMSLQ